MFMNNSSEKGAPGCSRGLRAGGAITPLPPMQQASRLESFIFNCFLQISQEHTHFY